MIAEQFSPSCQLKSIDANMESSEDSNDEIQRYMHGRGCSKRHTVGCTDDLSKNPSNQSNESPHTHSPVPSSTVLTQNATSTGRTRRTGLLTVMERPPGNFFLIICFVFHAAIIGFKFFQMHAFKPFEFFF